LRPRRVQGNAELVVMRRGEAGRSAFSVPIPAPSASAHIQSDLGPNGHTD
jgi:hypothetical protein